MADLWKCEAELPCGHLCGRLGCANEDGHKTSEGCRETCSRKCPRGHPLACKKFCFQPCEIKCRAKVKKKLSCSHVIVLRCPDCDRAPACEACKNPQPSTSGKGKIADKRVRFVRNGEDTETDSKKTTVTASEKCSRTCAYGHSCSRAHASDAQCPPCYHAEKKTFKSCGHQYEQKCGDTFNRTCVALCQRQLKCGHPCGQLCSVLCDSRPCQAKVPHKFKDCGHTSQVSCSDEEPLCYEKVYGVAMCGHPVSIPCYYSKSDPKYFSRFCTEKCSAALSCGHLCSGNCHSCHLGRFHVRCKEKCGKPIVCGHYCETGCSNACPPCNKPCENYCEHGPCTKICGVPCDPCQEPCEYSCPHFQCTMLCHRKCNRRPCFVPCPNRLSCGHFCVGFCGDVCSPLCHRCDKDKLILENMGMIDLDEDPKLRFVYLDKCGHTIEVKVLKKWLNTKNCDGEIKPKQCPLCRTTIWNCRRFRNLLEPGVNEVMLVKRKIYGDQDQNAEKELNLRAALTKLTERRPKRFTFFLDYLCSLLYREYSEKPKQVLDAAEELIRIYSNAEEFMETYQGLPAYTCVNIEFARTITNTVAKCFDYVFTKLKSTELPLTQQEAIDASNELARIEHMRQLLERQYGDRAIPSVNVTAKCNKLYLERLGAAAKHVFNVYAAYSKEKQYAFLQKLKDIDVMFGATLGITDRERVAIVQVFGTKSGRWFKCRNGHIYVITECGGPTQKGICNECGVPIGGQHHALRSDNQLATEMDGADRPLYPTALHR